jgi:hypothetical protein
MRTPVVETRVKQVPDKTEGDRAAANGVASVPLGGDVYQQVDAPSLRLPQTSRRDLVQATLKPRRPDRRDQQRARAPR